MFYTLTKIFVYKLLLRVSQNSGHYQFSTFFLFAQKFSLRNTLCRRQRRSWEVLQIAGKLHRGFIPVRGGVRGKLPPDGTSHSQSKISPVAIKGGRESDCECMSQNTNPHRKPQDKPRSRSYRPQGAKGRRKSLQKWGFATAPTLTPPYVPSGIRQFNNLSTVHYNGWRYRHIPSE